MLIFEGTMDTFDVDTGNALGRGPNRSTYPITHSRDPHSLPAGSIYIEQPHPSSAIAIRIVRLCCQKCEFIGVLLFNLFNVAAFCDTPMVKKFIFSQFDGLSPPYLHVNDVTPAIRMSHPLYSSPANDKIVYYVAGYAAWCQWR